MGLDTGKFTELAEEFELVGEAAAEAGVADRPRPKVRRSWVNVPTGGHVSGVLWGDGPPETVLLHDVGESARARDESLWNELARLDIPVALVRGDWAGQLAADLDVVRQRVPHIRVLTIPGTGPDIAATQPAALATALGELLINEEARHS